MASPDTRASRAATATCFPRQSEILDYLMEGFVPYLVTVERASDGLRLRIGKTGSNRDRYVDPFVEQYLLSKGFPVSKQCA